MFIILILVTQLFYSTTAFPEAYKWVDDNGRIVYGDKPTTSNAEKIKIKKSPEKNEQDRERRKKQKKLLDIIKEERDEKIALKKEDHEKRAQQRKECAEANKKLKKMKDSSFLYKKTDDPDNPKLLSDEERKIEEGRYENYINENC